MKKLDYTEAMARSIKQISGGGGAFLIAQSGTEVNTMTIGWATIGHVWGINIMMVAVRPSRHTFNIIEHASDFVVSVPLSDMSKELSFCGTRSGRDCDKFTACNLSLVDAQKVATPVLKIAGIHFECTTVFKQPMDSSQAGKEVLGMYGRGDFHTLYYGAIAACYETE